VLLPLLVGAGCTREEPVEAAPVTRAPVLADATPGSGLDFVHRNGASERKLLPETMGSGVAIFDADGDGLPDVLFVDGGPLDAPSPGARLHLYRNLGDLRFAAAEGAIPDFPFYGMGVAVGDVDGDGALDLFVTGVGGDRLLRNDGHGSFADVTARWGLPIEGGFGSSAAFFDADGDGDLDLFAGRYVEWSLAEDRNCTPDGVHRVYCTPEAYPAVASRFYRNLGGRFVDATAEAGLAVPGKALGVVVLDVDHDARLDIAIANDTVPNLLFVNVEGGPFVERGLESGFALGATSAARGGMGIAAGDLDDDGREDVVIGNFANEMAALFHALGDLLFEDRAAGARLGMPTLLALAFGTAIADLDNDGALDVLFANGHIEPSIGEITDGRESWSQPLQVFRNRSGAFEEVESVPERPLVGRGLASGDLDGDGDLDLVVTQNGGSAVLLRNDSPPRDWLRVRLRGPGANTWGLGAEVTVELADGDSRVRRLEPSGSYLSASEPVLHVGLGGDAERGIPGATVSRLVVRWPGGGTDVLERPGTRRTVEIAASGAATLPATASSVSQPEDAAGD
jgi:hypothetical protein